VKVFRCQLPHGNPFYSRECPQYNESHTPASCGGWCTRRYNSFASFVDNNPFRIFHVFVVTICSNSLSFVNVYLFRA